ncbi:trypsin-like peptidase domain-containing protein [Streptomyces sp. NPDC051658]|uniref:trypsin-like peptidase domain-containing protein n=1 Tax=Streptomyces sp. NPDC051658 TaxID=3365667 RepID=UPI0037A9C4B2
MDSWRKLLEAATVALDLPDDRGCGTGFVLAPGTVVTCAHVVSEATRVRGRVVATGHELVLTVSADDCYRAANGLDLAFLHYKPDETTSSAPTPAHVLTSPHTALADRMSVYGHPRGDFRAGQWAALEYLGDSRLSFDDPMAMPRAYGTPVGEGFSGSPVVNRRTGAVCGMLVRSNKAGSTHMIPLSEILARHPLPEAPVAWLNTLTDEQLRAGEFRHPGPQLRDYLAAARDAADEHPYAALLTDVRDIPLSSVYVRQNASHTGGDADEDRDRQPHVKRPKAESVLDSDRHVLFTGGAGSGKSSLLRRLTFTAASDWLTDPAQAPQYVPVRITAEQLLSLPFPEALATAVGRDLPGLRRTPTPEFFETAPMPAVDWLVCVDGLDEVLDPDGRAKVIRMIQRWSQEPHLRFVVATRSLVTTDMDRLRVLKRYSLLSLGDRQIAEVAQAWFEALKVPDPEQRAQELTAGLRHGRLGEVARIPLYITMICVVAALTELPRNPAELYTRFVRILREKGSQRLARTEAGVHGITEDLLNSVHDVLRPAAELRQGGDTRPLLDLAVELLGGHAPDAAPPKELVSRALMFTGLVTQIGGDLKFPHQTIQEYLAGCAIADRLTPKDPEALRTVRQSIAAEQPNIVLFISARWHERGMPLEKFLRTVVDGGGWRDLLLCATVLSDGLVINEDMARQFTRAVLKLHGRSLSVGDLEPTQVLARLYAVLDPAGVAAVVRNPAAPHRARVDALWHCARRDSELAAPLAAELADEPDLPVGLRVSAAKLLAEAGDPTAAGLRLTELARDPGHLPEARFRAAVALLTVDRAAGTTVLSELFATSDFPKHHVESAALGIHAASDPATRALLADALATNPVLDKGDPHILRYLECRLLSPDRPELARNLRMDLAAPVHLRYMATWDLSDDEEHLAGSEDDIFFSGILRDPESSSDAVRAAVSGSLGEELVERAARNTQLDRYTRLEAATRLVQLGKHTVAAQCTEEVLFGCSDIWIVPRGAEILRELGQQDRSREILVGALDNGELSTGARIRCAPALVNMGAQDMVVGVLNRLAEDPDTAAHERLEAITQLHALVPAAPNTSFTTVAADATLPGGVRHSAAEELLNSGERDTASGLLRLLAEDRLVGTGDRIDALTTLAEIDLRAASDTLHRMLDESGLLDEHLCRLLDLADALTPDATLQERLHLLLEDPSVPAASLLEIESDCEQYRTDIVPLLRKGILRTVDGPSVEPQIRARAVARSFGWVPYPKWKALVAELSTDPMVALSLYTAHAGMSSQGIHGGVWEDQSHYRDPESISAPTGALQGLDPHTALARWLRLLEQRRPEAVTSMRNLGRLPREAHDKKRANDLLHSWAADPEAPLTERISAAETSFWPFSGSWHTLARNPETPSELRVSICKFLATSGAHNRIPITRALVADPAAPVTARAKAAALLAEDLGEEGRGALRELSGAHTTDPEAHLAAVAAWEELDVGREAVAACLRVLDDERSGERSHARHRVAAAAKLARWRSSRGRAVRALKGVLGDGAAPVAVRIDAGRQLIAVSEVAEAHLGLLRLAASPEPDADERARIADLLPADLRRYAGAATERGAGRPAP